MGSLKDLEVAFDVADRAAALALRYFDAGVTSTPKADGSPVTEADLVVERLLRESLRELRPADAVLGEEHGQVGDSERIWIVDPIDGTGFFSRREPNWRVHVALEMVASQSLRWSRRRLSAFVGGPRAVAAHSNQLGRGSRARLVALP